jgi:hypothetical protein
MRESPIASHQHDVAEFRIPRTFVVALTESIRNVAVENKVFERIVVSRVQAPAVVCHQNVTVKVCCASQRRTVVCVGLTSQDSTIDDDFERRVDVVNASVLEDYGAALVQTPWMSAAVAPLGIGSAQFTCAQDAVEETWTETIASASEEVVRIVDGW